MGTGKAPSAASGRSGVYARGLLRVSGGQRPVALIACASLLSACTDGDALRVFAAASVGQAMEEAGEAWTARSGVEVRVTAAGSQVLRRQIEAGAPADVYAPASFAHLEGAVSERLEAPALLGCNHPVVVARPGSSVRALSSLDRAERIVLGAPEAPIGAYADAILARATERYGEAWRRRVDRRVVSREIDVRQVLTKVQLGEADAAIVYASDAAGSPLRVARIPDGLEVEARYPVAVVADAPAEARDFARWLREDGFAHLERHGWTRCEAAP